MIPKTSKFSGRKKRYILAIIIGIAGISIALYNAHESESYKNYNMWNFDKEQESPIQNTSLLDKETSKDGMWIIKSDDSAPSKPHVLTWLPHNNTGSTYHVKIMQDVTPTSSFKSSVKFKISSGNNEKAAGFVIRFQDPSHYFVLVADASASRFSLCRSEPDMVICTQDVNTKISTDKWHTITAQVSRQGIAGYLDNRLLIQRYDQHYLTGVIGVWTKENTEAYFDDVEINY